MWLFRPKYRDKSGKQKEGTRWWIGFRDHKRTVRKLPAFKMRDASEQLGRQVERLVAARINPTDHDPQMARWLRDLPSDIHERLVRFGLLDARQAAAAQPLAAHVDDFQKSMEANDRDPKHIRHVCGVLRTAFEACGFMYWRDISAARLQAYLASLRDHGRGCSKRTYNHKLKSCRQFARWMVLNQRASESPIAHLVCINERTDRRRQRRVLEVAEIRRLLAATRASGTRYGLTGPQRALLYRVATETGMRANELRQLRVCDIDLENRCVAVQAAYAKGRREDVLPLRPDTVEQLRDHLREKLPAAQAFKVPMRTADMLRADLEEADIDYTVGSQVFDFHALRHEAGSLLAANGVHPKVAQSLLRHSDINLTLSLYSHTLTGQEAEAIMSLPDLEKTDNEDAESKTGT